MLFLLFVATAPARGFETDQYMTWSIDLADSSSVVNEFVNRRFQAALVKANRQQGTLPCHDTTRLLYQDLVGTLLNSRLRRFLHDSDAIDRFPQKSVSYGQYRKRSVLRRKAFPMLLPMSRTVRVGDVYVGTDKFGHFFGFGRRYYKRYATSRKRGASVEQAERIAVLWGLRMERTMVGGWADGIVSHADLEANYQGMALARAMCEGDDPILEQLPSGDFRLTRDVDLRNWFNPNFDESFNGNHYMYYRWRLVRPILEQEVCPRLMSDEVQARFDLYRKSARPSRSMQIIEDFYAAWGRRPQDRHSLANVCSRLPASR